MTTHKKTVLVQVLEEIKAGLSPAEISRKHSIPKTTISYHVAKLKKMGNIERVGYGTWRYIRPLKRSPNLTTRQYDKGTKEVRGHAFIWKIEFNKKPNWEAIVSSYKNKKLTFQYMKHNKILRTIFNNRKIWLGKNGLTIYEPIDFMGYSSFEVKGMAVYEMDLLVKGLLKELGLPFRPYRFTTSREHYGLIKNELARQYNKNKEKMIIKAQNGSTWLWIDDSKGLGELETNNPDTSQQVRGFWNEHRKHNFQVGPDFILNVVDKQNQNIQANADNLNNYAVHLKAHVQSVKDLGAGVKELVKQIKELKNNG